MIEIRVNLSKNWQKGSDRETSLLLPNFTKKRKNIARKEYKYRTILYSWLFCTVKKASLSSRLHVLRFSFHFTFSAL